ncbi:hypothetical protein VMCG_09649 [Cytospora schulzeri]|uniref:Uncharacterized protein n=1 Tax=Cytospora schulzeri TaxID=448051 RepID=A0A423VEF2_9PEZI|nr:hypothetical protein VMCG_09649 [Valsa malicola]
MQDPQTTTPARTTRPPRRAHVASISTSSTSTSTISFSSAASFPRPFQAVSQDTATQARLPKHPLSDLTALHLLLLPPLGRGPRLGRQPGL